MSLDGKSCGCENLSRFCLAENIVFGCIPVPAGGVCALGILQVHEGLYASEIGHRNNFHCLASKEVSIVSLVDPWILQEVEEKQIRIV